MLTEGLDLEWLWISPDLSGAGMHFLGYTVLWPTLSLQRSLASVHLRCLDTFSPGVW